MPRILCSTTSHFSPLWFALIAVIAGICVFPATGLAAEEDTSAVIVTCYAIADERDLQGGGQDSLNTLTSMNFVTGESTVIGLTGTNDIEAMTFGPGGQLYAVNAGQVGRVNLTTGLFTSLPAPIGTGNGSDGTIALGDVDGIAYSQSQNIFYATRRRGILPDLLFAIDTTTGAHIPNFFGTNVDYVRVPIIVDEGGAPLGDVDDLAIDPDTGVMYAAINQGGSGGVLATVDPLTGIATRVATFRYPNPYPANPALAGQIIDDVEGLSFFNNGALYASTGNNGPDANDLNRLFRIILATGQGVVIAPFPTGPKDYEALGCMSALAFIHLVKATNGPGQLPDDADTPTGPNIRVGDTVTWTYNFTNTGFFTLTEFSLVDDRLGPIGPGGVSNCPPAGTVLGPSEAFTCIATGVAQQGQYSNTATITALTEVGAFDPRVTISDTNVSHYIGLTPGIIIRKLTNGQDANDPNGTDVPVIKPGGVVTWTYIVTNTSQVPFSSVVVTDDIIGPITNRIDAGDGDAFLEPGESWLYTATGVAVNLSTSQTGPGRVAGCDPGHSGIPSIAYHNIGTVVADELTASDPSHYCNPSVPVGPGITIHKLTNGLDANDPNGTDVPVIKPGGVVTWTYIVINTGQVPFGSVVVTDDIIGPITNRIDAGDGDAFLEPGESWLYTATGVAVNLSTSQTGPGRVAGCDPGHSGIPSIAYHNIGTVVADELTASDPSHYCNSLVSEPPGIIIRKLTNGQDANDPNGTDVPVIKPGGVVTWTYIVTNTGQVPFSSVVVTDDIIGPITNRIDAGDGDAFLEPGESWLYTATGVAVNLSTSQTGPGRVAGCDPGHSGIPSIAYHNIGTVVADELTASDPSHYCNPSVPVGPGITIHKLTNGLDANDPNGTDVPVIKPGGVVTWTYIVINTGQVPFGSVVVTDDIIGPITNRIDAGDGDAFLEPGESWLYTATGIAVNLSTSQTGPGRVAGCDPGHSGIPSIAYHNIGTVVADELTASDPSHYCNSFPTSIDPDNQPGRPVKVYVPTLIR